MSTKLQQLEAELKYDIPTFDPDESLTEYYKKVDMGILECYYIDTNDELKGKDLETIYQLIYGSNWNSAMDRKPLSNASKSIPCLRACCLAHS